MKGQNITKLFEPIELNNNKLKNRIAMAPMTRSRAINNLPNELIAIYYSQRALAGLIITEGVSPSPNGLGYARIPGIYSNEQVEAWKQVTAAVHHNGGRIFAQLMHTGRISHIANMPTGAAVLAPSAVRAAGDMWTDSEALQPMSQPAAMTAEQVTATMAEFVQASENAIQAGFDGIELHGANGYLLEQFLNPHTNTRTDDYGGSVHNRIRFVVELVQAIAAKIGKDKVAIRLSPYNTFNDMHLYEEVFETYTSLAAEMDKVGIAYLHIVDYAARYTEEGQRLLKAMRENFKGIFMLNGGYTAESAAEVIDAGAADMVSFGRPFIANPDLPNRFLHNIPLTEADASLFYTPGAEGYTEYAPAEYITAG